MENSIHGINIHHVSGSKVFTFGSTLPKQDFSSGIFAAILGMGSQQVGRSISTQLENYMHSYQYGSEIQHEYLERLCKFTGYEAAYMFSSGTEAVEAAWKIARRHTCKPGIIGLEHAFHGKTMGAQIAAGRMCDWRNQTPGDNSSCIIMEPYEALTCRWRDQKTIDRILHLKNKFNLLLIADEIQAGFYRTGKMFGYEHYGPDFRPDLVCIGKAMGNGFPVSAVLGPAALIDSPIMELSSTNGGNPLACAAGMAVLDALEGGLIDTLGEKEEIFHAGLNKLKQPVQGKGLVASIWFESVQRADQAVIDLCEAGVLAIHTKHQTVKLAPPLIIETGELINGVKIIQKVLKRGL